MDSGRWWRGATLATAVLFAANGAVFGALVPRLPEFKDALGLGAAGFGAAMAAFPAGALLGGLIAPLLLRRASDGSVAVAGMVCASVLVMLLGLSPGVATFVLVMAVFGLCDAVTDVAMNAHGIRVQMRTGASMINRFHALWSLGAVLAGVAGSSAAGLGIGVTAQLAWAGLVCAAVSAAVWPSRLRVVRPVYEPGEGEAPQNDRAAGSSLWSAIRTLPASSWMRLLALGLLAGSATVVEEFAQNWSALYLRDVVGVGAAMVGAGFVAVQGMQLSGRLFGDVLVERRGAAAVARDGGLCVVAGVALILASGLLAGPVQLGAVLVGLAAAGWGVATVIPGAMVAADVGAGPGNAPAGLGLSVLNLAIRVGFLVSPPLVGLVAEYGGMPATVVPMLLAGVVIALLAGRLRDQP